MPSHDPSVRARPKQGPFPPATLFVVAIDSTTTPSDSRCAGLDFAFGLYETPCRDGGPADGPLSFRTSPWTRAAPRTPGGPDARSTPDSCASDVAFAVT